MRILEKEEIIRKYAFRRAKANKYILWAIIPAIASGAVIMATDALGIQRSKVVVFFAVGIFMIAGAFLVAAFRANKCPACGKTPFDVVETFFLRGKGVPGQTTVLFPERCEKCRARLRTPEEISETQGRSRGLLGRKR